MLAGENPEATKKVKQFYKNFYLNHPKYEFDDAIDFLENEFDLSNIKFHYSKKFLKDYSIAKERYNSLKERCFERLISELFFKHYFIKNSLPVKTSNDFEDGVTKEKLYEENKEILKKEGIFIPTAQDIQGPEKINELVRDHIKKQYDNMRIIRSRNQVFEAWKKNKEVKEAIKNLNKDFDIVFDNILPWKWFATEFYKENDFDRCCDYCDISESRIKEMNNLGEIYTKRFYSRGSTMEVDQKHNYEGYTQKNVVLSCYWCNNAKSDEFTYEEFKNHIAPKFREIFEKRFESKNKKVA